MQRIIPKFLGLRGNLKHLIIWKRWRFLLARLLQKLMPMHSNGETWCNNMSENPNNCPKTRNYPTGLKLVEKGQYLFSLDTEEGQEMQHFCQEYTMPRNEKKTRAKGWILKNTRNGPVLNIKVCYRDEQCSVEVQVPSLFQDDTVSWVRFVNGVDRYVTESMLTKEKKRM